METMGIFKDNFTLLKKASEPLYKTPKSVQQTIEILKISEGGIFEVAPGKYSKSYKFSDVNYTTRSEDEQESFFQKYCKCLNSLDCVFKITVNNKNKDMEALKRDVMLSYENDGFDKMRKSYNNIIEEKIMEGRQGIEQERYITITIERKNFEEAKAQFTTIENSMFKSLYHLQEMRDLRCFMIIIDWVVKKNLIFVLEIERKREQILEMIYVIRNLNFIRIITKMSQRYVEQFI